MNKEKIYETANETWGSNAQLLVVIEECAELQKAICKHMNRGEGVANILEETADVEIMCEQIRQIFKDKAHIIDEEKKCKLRRLAKKLGILGEV